MSYSNANIRSKPADPYKEKILKKPSLKDKVEDLVALPDKCKFCMMTTRMGRSRLLVSRCIALAAKEGNDIDLLFHANSEPGKTDDLTSDPDINLSFLTPSGGWASIGGKTSVETDRDIVKKFYSPALKAWIGDLGDGKHNGGPDDPRICVIRVKAITAQYAISKRSVVGAFVELAKGVTTGKAPNVNRLRQLSEKELVQWRLTARSEL